MSNALTSAPAVLHHLQAEGFSVTTDGAWLWVKPRAKLTRDQAEAITRHRDDLIVLVADTDVLRRMIEAGRNLHHHALTLLSETGERARQAEARASMAELRAHIAQMELEQHRHQTAGIPPDLIGTLIRLCHPDKHNNSEAANKATTWLLKQRTSA